MKKNKTISVDGKIFAWCKDKPAGFASMICNNALRAAMQGADSPDLQPETKTAETAQKEAEKSTPQKIYVKHLGFVDVPEGTTTPQFR